jgi:NAD(P)-dependent dehydrogenase (short-subunit alcohol dehydrogenase family)
MSFRRTVLITGGTGGLGFHAARAVLADGGWEVVITGRAAVAGTAARLGDFATGRRLDLGSLAEVRRFARDLPPLDAVICNAGLMAVSGTRLTSDGIEETFGVNHLPGLNRHTPKQSGTALARLVLDQRLADTTGRYFSGKREIRSSVESYDTRKAADLWETSIALTTDPATTR